MHAIFSDRLAKPIGPFSPAVRSKSQGYIYVSGPIGQSAGTGKLIDGGTEQQTEQIFANLSDLLESCGRSFQDIVRSTVYLTSMAISPP